MTTVTQHTESKARPNNAIDGLPVYTKTCLARVGKSGTKSHRALVYYQVKNEGQPWEKIVILDTALICKMMGGCGRMYGRGIITMFNHSADKATCKHCEAKDEHSLTFARVD